MSIEIVGQQKYDFQDLVCIYLILLSDQSVESFLVESKEDAEIIFSNSRNTLVQVKGSMEQVSTDSIISYLLHFGDRQSDTNLLDRLINNDSTNVIFILSGRCNDDVKIHLGALDIKATSKTITLDYCKRMLEKISKFNHDESTTLKKQRAHHIRSVSSQHSKDQIKTALSKLTLVEQINNDTLVSMTRRLLIEKHHIPSDISNTVIQELHVTIKSAKETKENVLPCFYDVLEKYRQSSICPSDYIQQGCEDEWKKILSDNNVLLLSGSPRVGKSYVARRIADEFIKHGYRIEQTSDIDEARRFLLSGEISERLVLLDDPLGTSGEHTKLDANKILSGIKDLISNTKASRKLIISQVQDCLLQTNRKNSLQECKIANHDWLDLSKPSLQFLLNIWKAQEKNIPVELYEKVKVFIESGSLVLEAGCLVYLAANYDSLDSDYDLEKITQLARESAIDLGNTLSKEGYHQLLSCLAIGTTHNAGILEEEIAFLLGHGGEKLPAISNMSGLSYILGKSKVGSEQLFEKYEKNPKLPEELKAQVSELERKKILIWQEKSLVFSHPFYRSAAENLFLDLTRYEQENILKIVEYGLFCLSPATARSVADNTWIYSKLTNQESRNGFIEIFIKGLDSSYPSVRDKCFIFLANHLHEFENRLNVNMDSWIYKVSGYPLDSCQWLEGEPIYPMSGDNKELHHVEGDPFLSMFGSTYDAKLDLFLTVDQYISSENAWKIINSYVKKPDILTFEIMKRLLSYNEAYIRAKAISIWLAIERENDIEILDLIFKEKPHPLIAKQLLETVIKKWDDYTESRKQKLIIGLKELALVSYCAYPMLERLMIFDREIDVKDSHWLFFAQIFPNVLGSTKSLRINTARLYDIIEKASTKVSTDVMLEIIDKWIAWLERVNKKILPDDFALGIVDIFLEVSKEPSALDIRNVVIQRLLSLNRTGSLVSVISSFVNHWDYLSEKNKELIWGKLKEDRLDSNWLKGAVLTRNIVPIELQKILLPNDLDLRQIGQLQLINKDLFLSCIQIYLGHPQPLWHIATHHSGEALWKPIVEEIAKDPSHPLFLKALEEITYEGNGEYAASIIKIIPINKLQLVFDALLDIKLNTSGNFLPEVWDILFSLEPSDEVKLGWLKSMASIAGKVLDDIFEAEDWIKNKRYLNLFYSFIPDYLLISSFIDLKNLKNQIEELSTDEEVARETILGIIKYSFENNKPKLISTCDLIRKNIISFFKYNDSDVRFIDDYRTVLLESNKLVVKKPFEKPTNWID